MTISNVSQSLDPHLGANEKEPRSWTIPREQHHPKSEEKGFEVPDAKNLRSVLAESNISLNFHRDESSGRVILEMIDDATGEPIRQIPNEVSLRLSELFSKVQGQFFEARV